MVLFYRYAPLALIFAVFFIQGAAPVPEVNEPCYLGKAIHYWNPDWVQGDFFLETKDTHSVFYFTFGWLSLWLSPTVLAWVGRVLTWALLAWSWQRLSFAVIPRRGYSVLTAALLVGMIERCHLAGEWIVGGVEAKGFAFVLVFLGLEALARGRWNRVWLFLGAASAFHVLVGGWSVVAAGLAWVGLGRDRPKLLPMLPAVAGGFLLSLPGLIPALMLNGGVDQQIVRMANQIYVYGRLHHHLNPTQLPDEYVHRFALLLGLWLVLLLITPAERAMRRLQTFVAAAVAIGLVGVGFSFAAVYDQAFAADMLRFYWFRLADVAVPLGVALGLTAYVVQKFDVEPRTGKLWLAAAILLGAAHVGGHAVRRPIPVRPPGMRVPHYGSWREACDWIANSGQIPPDARFITPRMSQTFKWYAGRAEVVNWKEVPQDAVAIYEWWNRINAIHAAGGKTPEDRWCESLTDVDLDRLLHVARRYDADYLITRAEPPLPLESVYQNRKYAVYRMPNAHD